MAFGCDKLYTGGTQMKLRNKKTGEIGYPYFQNWKEISCVIVDENAIQIAEYKSLAELNEEWEDYVESKEYWYISPEGIPYLINEEDDGLEGVKASKAIGNYFETKEEAEKAVEKLKAFANLRKRGLKFNGWDEADRGMVGEFAIYCDVLELDGIERELEIVFGREEL